MGLPRWLRVALRLSTGLILAFIYLPIGIIVLYSFNAAKVATWPITSFTLDWYVKAFNDAGIRSSFATSVQVAIGATILAIVLGSLLALAVARFRFFGRETIAFIVILPLALPGIVTGLALNTAFRAIGFDFGVTTIIVGHATFCVVVIYNNAIARLRRTSRSFEEASTDLGADTFTTFRRITWPAIRTALIAGALLAFALSFDEIIVTNFLAGPGVQTLPIWIFNNYQRPNQLPLVNVAAVLVLLLSIIPVYVASRLTEDPASVAGRADLGVPAKALLRAYHFRPSEASATATANASGLAIETRVSRNRRMGHLRRRRPDLIGRPTPSTECPVRDRRAQCPASALSCDLFAPEHRPEPRFAAARVSVSRPGSRRHRQRRRPRTNRTR